MARDANNETALARLIGTVARRESLRPLTAPAVCRVVEHCARQSGDDGEFPTGSVNERVRNRLIELGQQRRRFAHEPEARDKTQ